MELSLMEASLGMVLDVRSAGVTAQSGCSHWSALVQTGPDAITILFPWEPDLPPVGSSPKRLVPFRSPWLITYLSCWFPCPLNSMHPGSALDIHTPPPPSGERKAMRLPAGLQPPLLPGRGSPPPAGYSRPLQKEMEALTGTSVPPQASPEGL